MRTWRKSLSDFLWRLRNARYQQQRERYAEDDERSAAYLKRTAEGAGDRPNAYGGAPF